MANQHLDMNRESREDPLELAAQHGLEIEQPEHGDAFVPYLEHQIFFQWDSEQDKWFFSVTRTGYASTIAGPPLGSNFFTSWLEGVTWGKQTIENARPKK